MAEPGVGCVRTMDGLDLATYGTGNPVGPTILFLHSFSQSAMCWQGQMDDPALAAVIPGAALHRWQGIGPAPFIKGRPRFSRELATFTFICQHGQPRLLGCFIALTV